MRKKKLYIRLAFILFSFSLLALVIVMEVNSYNYKFNNHLDDVMTEAPIVSDTVGVSIIDRYLEDESDLLQDEAFNEKDNEWDDVKNQAENQNNDDQGNDKEFMDDSKDKEEIILSFTGDVYLSRHVIAAYEKGGIKNVLSQELLDEVKKSDMTMINQEFPFGNNGEQAKDKQYTFLVEPKYIEILKDMDIDIVTLANNHTLDFGQAPLLASIDLLKEHKIQSIGAGKNLEEAKETVYSDIKGKKIAFLGASRVIPTPDWTANAYNPGLFTTYDSTLLKEEIGEARKVSDIVIVYVHWGKERANMPEKYQRNLAYEYIDSGADLVIGSHPHVLQGIEYYKGKPIVYSLGNFIFNYSIEETALLNVTIKDDNSMILNVIPAYANAAKTDILPKKKWDDFYKKMESISMGVTFDFHTGQVKAK